jgi:hypothetical protein
LYGNLQYSICRHLRTPPRLQHFNMFPWTHRSIKSMKIPIMYPAASTAKIGATVTMLTSIIDGCFSGSFKTATCLKILSLIPLSRNCVNLWRKFFCVKSLINCHFKFSYKNISIMTVWNEIKRRCLKDLGDNATVRYLKALPIVTREKDCESCIRSAYRIFNLKVDLF